MPLSLHAHFYQPPRENPWLSEIDPQPSASPFPDWNSRIAAECYAPLAPLYSRLSFNVGPTLLSWLERKRPGIYTAILAADKKSIARLGRGSAIAQAHGHTILPLANPRDRRTQVLWGIRDFQHRFRRPPEGLWLPETAADTPTLESLAELGIAFAILAPRQAAAFRQIGAQIWTTGDIDTTRPYLCPLPSGRAITLFFYNAQIAHDIAFGDLLDSGGSLARHLLEAADSHDGLTHFATDGETYGHHKRTGAEALADAIAIIDAEQPGAITNHAAYLAAHPPTHEVRIAENTSWSCPHGIDRWRAGCGCSTGAHPDWTQQWRGALREALDHLRDRAAALYEQSAGDLFKDPWSARDDSIDLFLDPLRADEFLSRHAAHALSATKRTRALDLLELQRHAMLMYTSCAWFFDDVSGIEAVQVLQSAARVVQLARRAAGTDLEPALVDRLALARGNNRDLPDARRVYEHAISARPG